MTSKPEFQNVPLTPNMVLQNRYRIIRQLGRGGMGAVYEAIDERLQITVALKETLSSETSMRRQFEREARLLAGMQHPALPRVSDHFVEGNRAFLVMQFIGGIDLAKIIAQQPGPFPREQVIAWADQLLDALVYLHSRDRCVVHRDIKPHNLKLTAGGQIALLDFGLAKAQAADSSLTASKAFFGYTKHYAPLEQIQDQQTDSRSDIYALGATLYHLLTGTKPPDALVRAAALIDGGTDPLVRADRVNPAVGPVVAEILNKAMAQRAEDRYETATAFREALRRVGRTKVRNELPSAAVAETIHVSGIRKVEDRNTPTISLALVGSAKRFGPAGATAFLVISMLATAGLVYAPPHWLGLFDRPAADDHASFDGGTPLRIPIAGQRNDSSRSRDTSTALSASRSSYQSQPAIAAKRAQMSKAHNDEDGPKDAAVIRKSGNSTKRKPAPVEVPGIRFPKPDVQFSAPVGSPESRLRIQQSPHSLASNAPPKFYRSADGTQIIQFDDGTTRTIRARGIAKEIQNSSSK